MFIKINKVALLLSILLCACGGMRQPSSLIGVDQIHQMLTAGKRIQIIDVRKEEEYLQGHIPSAIRIWRDQLTDKKNQIEGMMLEKSDLEMLLGSMGFNSKDSIYLYDAKGNVDASRLWWILQYYGFEKVALIDGGYIQWRLRGLKFDEGGYAQTQGNFHISGEKNEALLATKENIINKDYEQLIDARSKDEYTGLVIKNGAFRGGHIPNSVLLEYHELMNGSNFTIRPKAELEMLLQEKGISMSKKTITYCHSGVRSAYETFVLKEVLGFESVANYDGSWIEWSEDVNLPVEVVKITQE